MSYLDNGILPAGWQLQPGWRSYPWARSRPVRVEVTKQHWNLKLPSSILAGQLHPLSITYRVPENQS